MLQLLCFILVKKFNKMVPPRHVNVKNLTKFVKKFNNCSSFGLENTGCCSSWAQLLSGATAPNPPHHPSGRSSFDAAHLQLLTQLLRRGNDVNVALPGSPLRNNFVKPFNDLG